VTKPKGKIKTVAKEIDPFSPHVVRRDDWASPHVPQPSFIGGAEKEQQAFMERVMEHQKVESPRAFQVEAVFSLVFGDSKGLLLVRKTGKGK
jgi:uncharacterized protein (DUF2267 family)